MGAFALDSLREEKTRMPPRQESSGSSAALLRSSAEADFGPRFSGSTAGDDVGFNVGATILKKLDQMDKKLDNLAASPLRPHRYLERQQSFSSQKSQSRSRRRVDRLLSPHAIGKSIGNQFAPGTAKAVLLDSGGENSCHSAFFARGDNSCSSAAFGLLKSEAKPQQEVACNDDYVLHTEDETGAVSDTEVGNEVGDELVTQTHLPTIRSQESGISETLLMVKHSSILTGVTKEGLRKAREFSLKVFQFLDDPTSGFCAWFTHIVMMGIIMFGVGLTLAQTTDTPLFDPMQAAVIETSVDGVFILEVILRFLACPNRMLFLRSIYNVIDVLSIGTFALRIADGFALSKDQDKDTAAKLVLVIVVPTLRALKVLRRCENLRLLWYAALNALEALVVPLFALIVLCLAFSGTIYVLEPRENIRSLPHAIWLVLVTISTVGYGQTMPSSTGGFLVTTFLIVCGVMYMALPISIVGNAWDDVWSRRFELLLMDRTRERMGQQGLTFKEITRLFNAYDQDKDAHLDMHEFHGMLTEMRLGLSIDNMAELFQTLDADNSGLIDVMEFTRVLFPAEYLEQDKIRKHNEMRRGSGSARRPSLRASSTKKSLEDICAEQRVQIRRPSRLLRQHSSLSRDSGATMNSALPKSLSRQQSRHSLEQSMNFGDMTSLSTIQSVGYLGTSSRASQRIDQSQRIDEKLRTENLESLPPLPESLHPLPAGDLENDPKAVPASQEFVDCLMTGEHMQHSCRDDDPVAVPASQEFVDCLMSDEHVKHI